MKYYIFYALLALMPLNSISSAQNLDSASLSRIMTNNNKPLVSAIENQTKILKDSLAPALAKAKPAITKPNKTVQDIITFLPVAFFLFLLLTVFIKLKKDGIKLSDILIDKETAQERIKSNTTVAVAAVNAGQPAPAPVPQAAPGQPNDPNAPGQSTSRLIAFICGITSIALACCITTYYFYQSFTGDGKVELGNLTNVLYGLGLGVLPYGFNKIAAALK